MFIYNKMVIRGTKVAYEMDGLPYAFGICV